MKLYYSPGACSLSPHIVLREAELPFSLEKMDGSTHQLAGGVDYYGINPKGSVPALQLDDGQLLTEGAVIVQYLADQKPAKKLAPPAGQMERYRLQEMLNFIATEVHKGYSPLFNPKLPDETRQSYKKRLASRYALLEKTLAKQSYLMGEQFSVADAYLFTVTRWSVTTQVDLSEYPAVQAFMARVGGRPAVQAALAAEGLN